MNELQHLGIYARELKKHLPREVFEPVPTRLLWFIPHAALIALCAFGILTTDWPVAIKIVLSLLIGHSMACLGFLGHEVLHGSVVKTPWFRDTLGGILFSPFGLSPKLWRRWHNVEHHGHTQHPALDPDAFDTLEAYDGHVGVRFLTKLPPRVRSFLYFISFTFWFSLHSLLIQRALAPRFKPRERNVILAQTIAPYLVWLALAFVVGFNGFLLLYVLPVLVANFIVISYIATNHGLNPMTETNDPLVNSLSVTNPRWLDTLHMNFSHHVEHHVLPSVNPVHAPRVKATLQRLYPDRYHDMPWGTALAALWSTPRFYGPDRLTFVDPEGNRYGTLGHGLEQSLQAPAAELKPTGPLASVTRWVGAGVSLAFLVFAVSWARGHDLPVWPYLAFGTSAALLYAASAVYRSFRLPARAVAWLRRLDRSAACLLVAGTFTPLAYFGLAGTPQVAALAFVWGAALAGAVLNLVPRLPTWVTAAVYFTLGIGMLTFLPDITRALPPMTLAWLGIGVTCYVVGAALYAARPASASDTRFRWTEAWHVFMLCGTVFTFAMTLHLT